MYRKLVNAGAISIVSLLISQLIRFVSNLWLAKLLMPEAFGVVAIVNMVLVGISLFSDIGIRQVIIQKQGGLEREFLNTIWVIQLIRGLGIFATALLVAGLLSGVQALGWVTVSAYADPLLPYLVAGASLTALFSGFESTKVHVYYRNMTPRLVVTIDLIAQLSSCAVMIGIAVVVKTPWALVAGGVTAAFIKTMLGHILLMGEKDTFYFDKAIASNILSKGRWMLLSSPLTFLELNGAVILLAGLLNSAALGVYLIAALLAGVVYLVSQNLASNVFFPGLCAAARNGPADLRRAYLRLQLVADGIVVTSAGALISGGPGVVELLFDHRYAAAGGLLSSLAIGLIGVRYSVIEQLINAKGEFKWGPPTILCRVIAMTVGIVCGHYFGGMQGAAIGVGLSWFAGWPILLWFRSRVIQSPWQSDLIGLLFLSAGYGLGILFTDVVSRFHLNLAS